MALKIDAKDIQKQWSSWQSYYQQNNSNGVEGINFTQLGEQWEPEVPDARTRKNKESLVLNQCKHHLDKMKSQSAQLEFGLNLNPINTDYGSNIQETNAFRILLHDLFLGPVNLSIYKDCLDKTLDYGYTAVLVTYHKDGDQSLCKRIDLSTEKDPSCYFFDKQAVTKFKTDGRYCGIRKLVSAAEIMKRYPKYQRNQPSWLDEHSNTLIDYWYRDTEAKDYFLLSTGEYKREDLLTDDDKALIVYNDALAPVKRTDYIERIYFMRVVNDHILEKPRLWPTDDKLPLVYHPALTFWTDGGLRTLPFCYHLMGAQKLYNFLSSSIATSAKNITADKFLLSREHVQSKTAQQNAQNINQEEGAFIFDGDIATIRREAPGQIPATVMQMVGLTKQAIDEMAGASVQELNAEGGVLSGRALDRITHNLNVLQVPIVKNHIEWVSEIGDVMCQMIPKIYTEQRTLVARRPDGNGQAIIINELLSTGAIRNNIKDIRDNYQYEIIAGPNSDIQKENTLKALLKAYEIDPTRFNSTADIFARCLDTPFSEELARRWGATIDPMLIKYSQGEISEEEFSAYMQQQQQKQQQAAMQSPEVLSAQAMASAEHEKAAAQHKKAAVDQYEAETKRQSAIGKLRNDQEKIQMELIKVMQEAQANQRDKEVEILKQQMQLNADLMRELEDAKQLDQRSY